MSLFCRLRLSRGLFAVSVMAALLSGAQAQDAPAAPASAASSVPRLPVEAFASLPRISNVVLSPDGRKVAALLNRNDGTLLIARDVSGSGVARSVVESDNTEFRFNWARWVNNERLLVSVRFADWRGSVATVETRLFSVKSDGTGLINLVKSKPDRLSLLRTGERAQLQDQVIDWLPEDGQHVLLSLSDSAALPPAVYKVNVETAARQIVHGTDRNVWQWMTDAQHRVRVSVRSDEGHYEIRACDPDGANWRTLWSFDAGAKTTWPLGFGRDPQELFVRADHEGRDAVFAVRLDQPDLPRRLLVAHRSFDVDGRLLTLPTSREVLGVSSGSETRTDLWNPGWRELMQAIDRGMPDSSNRLTSISNDELHYVVYSSGNGKPGQYYIGDRGTGRLAFMGDTYPELDPARLVGKRRAKIKASDGLELNVFLTLPAGRRAGDAGGPLPFVLLPHGGPQARDDDDFDEWTEFLANRGYGVLQVNFRGSHGYGRDFKQAGLQRWGLEMQDDLTDAVKWAVAQGVANARRICIVGGSYGGYAALMGVVKTPELYRCAVSFAGVTHLPGLLLSSSDYIGGLAAAQSMIGDAWRDRAQLRATSPALQAERIRAPVLLVHGSADRTVPVDQGQEMASALRSAGKRYRYIEQDGGDHYLSRHADRVAFFKALEAFLDEHLQPAAR